MASYWIFNTNNMTATPLDLQPGQVLAPPSIENGVNPVSEAALLVILRYLKISLQPAEGETQSDADARVRSAVLGASDPGSFFEGAGFTVPEQIDG